MEEKKIGYSIHAKGEMKKAVECPFGTYFVDLARKLYWFKPNEKFPHPEDCEQLSTAVAAVLSIKGAKPAEIVTTIIEHCVRINDKDIKETDDPSKVEYEFYLQGEVFAYVEEPTLGTLYGNDEKELFYFDPKHKGFMGPILKKKFREGVEKDIKSDDADKRAAAIAVIEIFDNWVELDEEDIVK
jgi:hypothetical protein